MAVSFIGGVLEETTDLSQVTDKLYPIRLYQVQLAWPGFEFTTLVVIGADCIGSCESNYITIMNTTAPNIYKELWYLFIILLFLGWN